MGKHTIQLSDDDPIFMAVGNRRILELLGHN